MGNSKKTDKSAQYTAFAAAVTANFPATQTWSINQVTYKRDDLVALAQGCIDAVQSTAVAHDAWIAATKGEEAKVAAFTPVFAGFKHFLEMDYGASSNVLAKYGYAAAKSRTQSAESKAAMVAKGKATRAAKKAALAAVPKSPPAGTAPSAAASPSPAPAPAAPVTGASKS